jgi:hypothetical protein
MSFGRRGGERRLARATNARAPGAGTKNRCPRSGDASFTRSEDPYTSILTMHRAQARWWGAGGDIAVGQTCVSGRNQHRGHRKRTECGSPRVIAPAREAAWHVRKGRRSRPPSLRGSRARVWLLARRCMLQKSAGDVWSRISSANALQKERQGRVNRDLALRNLWRVIPPLVRSAKRRIASPNSLGSTGEDRDKAQGGERSPSSGRTIAKSGEVVAGPGL